MRKILALFAVILAVSGVAMAMVAVNVTASDQTRWENNITGVASWSTQGGNITELLIDEQKLTDRWAGFYGNVTASVILRDNTSAEWLYIWTANSTNISGEFCASTDSAFDFASAVGANAVDIDSVWGFAGGLDLAVNTFDDGTCNLTIDQDANNVTGIQADGDSSLSGYTSCAIADTATPTVKGDFAFCANALGTGNNFKGEPVNFEFMVATNETGSETYYFFMELDA